MAPGHLSTRGRLGPGALLAALLALGCGPAELRIAPRDVVYVKVQPRSGQALFCPGERLELELIVKLRDGTLCSAVDASRGCIGMNDAVIDPDQVRVEASPGTWLDQRKLLFVPAADPLLTAQGGLEVSGQLVLGREKSMVGTATIAPRYECLKEKQFAAAFVAPPGATGASGLELLVSVTSLSTPWFPDAALVRIETATERLYLISPSADQPVKIVSSGQNGGNGTPGAPGENGLDGMPAPTGTMCTTGGDGQPGKNGGPGGNGGDGGAGGRIRLVLDDARSSELRARVIVENPGGGGGTAGYGGPPGAGGKGGAGGVVSAACAVESLVGKDGVPGAQGPPGNPGQAGAAGPPLEVSSGARATLFAAELSAIRKIEAAPRASQ